MKQFKFRLIALIMLLCSIVKGYAHYDFMVDGICYNIKPDTKVIVTYIDYDREKISYGVYSVYYNRDVEYVGAITIPSKVAFENVVYDVVSIGDYAFYNCNSLTSITLPESVTSIGGWAFYNCSRLTSITLPEGVTSIGSHAFSDCSRLTSITLPEGVTSIGSHAFYNCSSLTSITLPEGVTSIGERAFYNCSNLIAIVVAEGNKVYDSRNGCNAIIETADNTLIAGCSTTIIPSSVTSIGDYAFYGRSRLTSITLPECVTSIGERAFYNCSSLYKVLNYSSLPISKGSEDYGYVAYYAMQVLNVCELNVIGDYQFYTSNGIHYLANYTGDEKSLILPDSYNGENYMIDDYAFYGCSRLTSITLPSSVTSIGNYAFYNCTALKKVIIEDGSSTLSLGYNSYYSSSTGQGLFYDCPLEEVYLGRNLSYESGKSYGYSPFYNKDALTNVTIGDEVTEIGQYAFYDCDNIHSLTISNGVLSIGSSAFSTPDKVIWLTNTPPTGYAYAKGSINYVSNNQYTSLSYVQIYPYLSSMFEVDGVRYVPVSPSERTCHAIDCVYGDAAATINVGETASFKGVAMKVTEVMPYTFYGNKHVKEVAVSHFGNIGNYAFYNCDRIKIVNVSNQGNIGSQVFYDCDGIESVNVSNLGDIGSRAFYDCNGIKNVNIRNQGSIGSQAFYGCDGMETAIVANYIPKAPSNNDAPLTFADWTSTNNNHSSTSSETYTFTAGEGATLSFNWSVSSEASYDKLIATLDGITILEKSGSLSGTYSNAISKGSHTLVVKYTKDGSNSSGSDQAKVSNITVNKGGATTLIVGVGSEAFSGCSSLKTVILGDSIGSLGDKAFYQCSSLQEIAIPDSVKSVGTYCFSGCSALTNVELGDSVATINNYAFRNCSSLPEITLPQAVTWVGDYVFSGCSNLTDVIIADRTTALTLGSNGSSALFADCPLDSVYIGGKITYNTTSSYGYSPFYRKTSLRTVVITDREEQIYDNEFYGCTNLQDVTIGNGVKSIGDYAFSGCSSLEGFSFGSNMETIGAEAFSDCTSLTSITSHAAVPPACGAQALDDINKWSCTLRVPSGYAAAYQTADQWKEFFFVEDVVEVAKYKLTFMIDGEVYYTDSLVHKAEVTVPEVPEREGHTFSGWSEIPETMPAEDVTISGYFTVNKYLVTFVIDGEVIVSDSLEYGASIVVPVAPEKEGHTFNGWGEVAETVPAEDVTYYGSYSVNSYLLTYVVDGETVQSDSVAYGSTIVALEEPTKEGYTFSGWSEAPETMPAEDVTISGFFTVNKYLVTFVIDDEVIASDSLEYGASIVAPIAPEKEGHTFNGWGEVAETVPAEDVTYYGSYSVNSYLLTYVVDGETVQSDSVAYGSTIVALEEPTKEGHTFSGWGEVPETMPAEDVVISGFFTVNIYKVYYYVGDELVHTAEVAYGEAIPEYVYEPTAEGDVFVGWVGETYETMPAHDVTYTANIESGIEEIENSKLGIESSVIYDLHGRKIQVDDLRELERGVYIIDNKKVVIK